MPVRDYNGLQREIQDSNGLYGTTTGFTDLCTTKKDFEIMK